MRIFSHHPTRLARALFAASFVVVAAGCAGSSNSGLPNTNGICDPNAASISVARPTPGFPQMNGNTVEIVSSTDQDQLHGFPGQFDLNLFDNFGSPEIDTGFLTLVPDPAGPHPYTNDFFYQGTLSVNLLPGRTYRVFLNAPNTNCQPGFIGNIFT